MANIWKGVFLVVFAAVTGVCHIRADDGVNMVSEDFDVKPGGVVQEHEQSWVSTPHDLGLGLVLHHAISITDQLVEHHNIITNS